MNDDKKIMQPMTSAFTNYEDIMELPIEETGGLILEVINIMESNQLYGNPSLDKLLHLIDQVYDGSNNTYNFKHKIATAWQWLISQIMICPKPDMNGRNGCVFLTDLGKENASRELSSKYTKLKLLSRQNLHQSIQDTVLPLYIRGHYDTAIFEAYKAVEISTRKTSGYGNDKYGVDLMRQAFAVGEGPLKNINLEKSEQEAMAHLYAGAIGLYKNPQSHREVGVDDPIEAAEVIMFASHLLRMIDRHEKPPS
ncbi:MAG: TIGR02391 family protein [Alphaproteobacteria bacterium]|nr:TIGR02391 family protein [Alphaproteobacteria bacterium]